MKDENITVWGAADLRGLSAPRDRNGKSFPLGISFAVPMNPNIMAEIKNGPTKAYAEEYSRINSRIDEIASGLAALIKKNGFQALALAASHRSDPVNIRGDFPHKTVATRAGLGWIGRHCQLITREYGSWVRLGTVFTDMEISTGSPLERSYCGTCKKCVDACPAGALLGNVWSPGIPRKDILDPEVCDRWKKENYFQFHNGHNCGICSSVCPYGTKRLKSLNH